MLFLADMRGFEHLYRAGVWERGVRCMTKPLPHFTACLFTVFMLYLLVTSRGVSIVLNDAPPDRELK